MIACPLPALGNLATAPPPTEQATVADCLRRFVPDYLQQHAGEVSQRQQRILAKLMACRTPQLGTHATFCEACQHLQVKYNSCGERHCVTCGSGRRALWLTAATQWHLPVPYFHLVFTLPHELLPLIAANAAALYQLLFRAAADTLLRLAADPRHLGAQPGLLIMLHTWGQALTPHPHVHCLLSGGGLSADATRWVTAADAAGFAPRALLADTFRERYLAGIARLRARGTLTTTSHPLAPQTAAAWDALLAPLATQRWVVHCEPPPPALGDPLAAVKYLAGYASGTAIRDARIVELHDAGVTIRIKDYAQGGRPDTRELTGDEFVRRFLWHLLPRQLSRSRYYGLLASRYRPALLARCRELLGVTLRGPRGVPAEPPLASDTSDTREALSLSGKPPEDSDSASELLSSAAPLAATDLLARGEVAETSAESPATGESIAALASGDATPLSDVSLVETAPSDDTKPAAYQHACPACGRLGMVYLGELTPCPNRYQYRPIRLERISPAAQAAVLRYIHAVHGAIWEPDG